MTYIPIAHGSGNLIIIIIIITAFRFTFNFVFNPRDLYTQGYKI